MASRAIVNRTWGTILGWAFFVGVPILTVVAMLYSGRDVRVPGLFGLPAWGLVLLGIAFMTVLMPLTHMLNIWSYRRRNRAVGNCQTYTITPEGYSVSGSFLNTNLKSDAFLKVRETKRFILLYVSSRWAHFIPKSGIANSEDLSTIRSILRDRFGSKAKLRCEP